MKTKKILLACALAVGLGSASLAGVPANVEFQPHAQLSQQMNWGRPCASMSLECVYGLPPVIKQVVRIIRFLIG